MLDFLRELHGVNFLNVNSAVNWCSKLASMPRRGTETAVFAVYGRAVNGFGACTCPSPGRVAPTRAAFAG